VKTIFVVDDDSTFVNFLRIGLASRRWAVRGFTDPLRALAALTVPPTPDVLLVDLWMPPIDGEKFVVAARRRVPRAAFLFVTSVDVPAAFEVAARVGVPVLMKPFDLDTLRHTIECLLLAQ